MNDDVSAFCGGVISINTWEDELSIPVMATTDLVYDGDVTRQLNEKTEPLILLCKTTIFQID
jgi:hypothetical protein